MNHAQDKYNYQGQAYDFIGFDELTHFTWEEYSYLLSRNRPNGPDTPGLHPGHGQPRRHRPRMGEGKVRQPGPARHPDGTDGKGQGPGRTGDRAAADPHFYPQHRV